MPSLIMRYFEYGHLPNGPMRYTSAAFHALAESMDTELPDGAEKSVALRKLLEAKDAAVRSRIDD